MTQFFTDSSKTLANCITSKRQNRIRIREIKSRLKIPVEASRYRGAVIPRQKRKSQLLSRD